jgi:hypothetical protein
MFDKIRKAFSRDARTAEHAAASGQPSQLMQGPVSEWAATQGLAFSMQGAGRLVVEGKVAGRPWRMELGKPTRDYIRAEELRARAELGLDEDVAVMIINRPLKDALDKKAYNMITDSLQTTADPNLPEEMRWLAMYDEVGWESLPPAFWNRYAVLTDQREHALAWVDPPLAQLLLDWPEPAPGAEVPFLLLLLRGKTYLRMEYAPAEITTLQHAAQVFTGACESAVDAFKRPA